MFKRQTLHPYILCLVVLCAVNVVLHIIYLQLPAHYDEVNYFNGVLAVKGNNLNPFVSFWGYKPPLLIWSASVLFALFSPNLAWGRIIILFFSSLLLVFQFLLARRLFGNLVALSSAFLLFFTPLYFAQSFVFQDALPVTALSILQLYFFFVQKPSLYIIAGSAAVLTKETAVFLPVFLFSHELIRAFHKRKKDNHSLTCWVLSRLYLLVPLVVFTLWMMGNKIWLGWYLWPYNVSLFSVSNLIARVLSNEVFDVINWVYPGIAFWIILSVVVSSSLSIILNRRGVERDQRSSILLLVVLYVFYFLYHLSGPQLSRYYFITYPFVLMLFSFFLSRIILSSQIYMTIVVVLGFVFSLTNYWSLNYENSYGAGDSDLRLFSQIRYEKKTISFLERNYFNAFILADWPLNHYWETPLFGYARNNNRGDKLDCNDGPISFQILLNKYRKVLLVTYKKTEEITCIPSNKLLLITTYKSQDDRQVADEIRVFQVVP